jgi:hypothetical protein
MILGVQPCVQDLSANCWSEGGRCGSDASVGDKAVRFVECHYQSSVGVDVLTLTGCADGVLGACAASVHTSKTRGVRGACRTAAADSTVLCS